MPAGKKNKMAKYKFRDIRMSKANKQRLYIINDIIEEYQTEGYTLTLRQLYYQLVTRDIIPNKQAEYSKLSLLLKEGRMAGLVDWAAIEDRLRKAQTPPSFDSPEEILDAVINQYEKPRMQGQPNYLEVWVEKDALSGVLKRVTEKYHVPLLVNRGYSSASAMYDAFMRFYYRGFQEGKPAKVIYLGDYDPSGLDMIRDISTRVYEFAESFAPDLDFQVLPIALTLEQIKKFNPPPNPAKTTDPRAKDFIARHGLTSWEVDALRPEVLNKTLDDAILGLIDVEQYKEVVNSEESDKEKLRALLYYL